MRLRSSSSLLLLAAISGVVVSSASNVTGPFYVATNGNDSNQGTIGSPFLTPGKAQTAARAALVAGVTDPIVNFRSGIYPITSTLALTSSDSAASGHVSTWQSYTAENAIISGGVQVTGWVPCTTADSICNSGDGTTYQATVTDPANFRELYVCPSGTFVDCQHRPRAHGSEGRSVTGFSWDGSGNITAPATGVYGGMSSFGNKTAMEAIGLWTWGNTHCKIASISGSPPVANLNSACTSRWSWINGNGFATEWPLWIENAYEFLVPADPPGGGRTGCGAGSGCHYHDHTTHILYYQPRAGENMATALVFVPKLEGLVSGQVDNVTFSRLTFAFDSWLGVDSAGAYVPLVSGYHCSTTTCTFAAGSGTALHAAVDLSGKNITFDHTLFTHNAARGLLLRTGTQTLSIYANDCQDNGGGCAQLGENTNPTQANTALQTASLTVKDSRFKSLGFQYQDADELFIPFARDYLVTQNEFIDVARGPISTGWGGTGNIVPSSYSGGHTISRNKINEYGIAGDGFNGQLEDTGGIYNSGSIVSPYALWDANYILGTSRSQAGLYPDENSNNITLTSNVVDQALNRALYIWTSSINHITASGTWWSTIATVLDNGTADSITAPTTFTHGSPPAGALAVINAAGIEAGVTPGP